MASLTLALVLAGGCTGVNMTAELNKVAAGGPSRVVAIRVSGSPGSYVLLSAARLGIGDGRQHWHEAQLTLSSSHLAVEIELAQDDQFTKSRDFLTTPISDCGSPLDLLQRNFETVDRRFSEWMPGFRPPTVVLRLAGSGKAIDYRESSSGPSISSLRAYIGTSIFDAARCESQRAWASDTAQLVAHELTHVAEFTRYGEDIDLLSNEYVAYTSQFCLLLEFDGRAVYPLVVVAGLQIDSAHILDDEKFWRLVRGGKLPSTVAGWVLADSLRSMRFGPRELGLDDVPAMNEICRRVNASKPDVRNPEYLKRIYAE